jgi:wyosine [tRNA(Phe)-imidazoG37] synthetase (radical SAM superfamily)
MLFHEIIFGPVKSRRLGVSLGINLLPTHIKLCTFNCIYCECGWTDLDTAETELFHPRSLVATSLEDKLRFMQLNKLAPDAITFAGNGEPTMHPDFTGIIDDTVMLRNKYFPSARVVVLSNSTNCHEIKIRESLMKVEAIMKLDAGTQQSFLDINKPSPGLTLDEITAGLKLFQGKLTIQTMFVRGKIGNNEVDNTTQEELNAWIKRLEVIRPERVMIYSIDRKPPLGVLEKISPDELIKISEILNSKGFKTEVY